MKTPLFALSLLAALALPLAVQAEPETIPGKQSTTTSVPQPAPGTTAPTSGSVPAGTTTPTSGSVSADTTGKVPGKQSTTTSVPQPSKDSDAKSSK